MRTDGGDSIVNSGHRTAVVTGASSGIGKSAAKALAALGWRIIALGRDPVRCDEAQAEIRAAAVSGARVDMIRADLSVMAGAANASDEVKALTASVDVLINNAGGVGAGRVMTVDGHEATFASNHLGPFLLTNRLLPLLRAAALQGGPGAVRIIAVSSSGHHGCPGIDWEDVQLIRRFTPSGAYMSAKLANVLFTRALAKRLKGCGIVAHAMEPGIVLESNFSNHAEPTLKAYMATQTERAVSCDEAAQTLVWLATAGDPGLSSGGYFYQCKAGWSSAASQDEAAAERLWAQSEALIGAHWLP